MPMSFESFLTDRAAIQARSASVDTHGQKSGAYATVAGLESVPCCYRQNDGRIVSGARAADRAADASIVIGTVFFAAGVAVDETYRLLVTGAGLASGGVLLRVDAVLSSCCGHHQRVAVTEVRP